MSELAPAEGRFEGKAFVFPIRVYYEDTDFSGLVYHANYLHFMERGRSEFLRVAEVSHQAMLGQGEPLVWAVRRIKIDYLKPARVEEALTIRTALIELTGARMRLAQEVRRGLEVLAGAEVEVCLITLDGRPRRVPDGVRTILFCYLGN